MPVGGGPGAAPWGEARRTRQADQVVTQREVVDQHGGQRRVQRRQPRLGQPQALGAPCLATGERSGVEIHLVGADVAPGRRPPHHLVPRYVGGTETVVVEKEEGRDHAMTAGPLPQRVRVFGRQHPVFTGQGHQRLVAGLSAQWRRSVLFGHAPQFVIARHPQDFREAAGAGGEGLPQQLEAFGHVAGQDQPVGGKVGQGGQGMAVGRPGQVQIADGHKPHPPALTEGARRRQAAVLPPRRIAPGCSVCSMAAATP